MLIRRCAALVIEPRETLALDLHQLLQGESGLAGQVAWFALAAHLDDPVPVDADDMAALAAASEVFWVEEASARRACAPEVFERLLRAGLLISDVPDNAHRLADETVRANFWRPLSAIAHRHGRWSSMSARAADDPRLSEFNTVGDMVARYGEPPTHAYSRADAGDAIALPAPADDALDALLSRRATCRNFDTTRALALHDLAACLRATFGARHIAEMAPGAAAIKKAAPSGGGLHPVEAYVLARSVDDLSPGLYHYHCVAHTLEPLRALADDDAMTLAARFVADQAWFADAHALVVLTARFARNFWKYRNHPKAYRVVVLDAGHLSQTLYLSATARDLGVFVTAAINERDIEQALALDPMSEGPLLVCGLGPRAASARHVEYDPQRGRLPLRDAH